MLAESQGKRAWPRERASRSRPKSNSWFPTAMASYPTRFIAAMIGIDRPARFAPKGQGLLRSALDRVAGVEEQHGPSLRPDRAHGRRDARQTLAEVLLGEGVLRGDVAVEIRGVEDRDRRVARLAGERRGGREDGERQRDGENPQRPRDRSDGTFLRRASLAGRASNRLSPAEIQCRRVTALRRPRTREAPAARPGRPRNRRRAAPARSSGGWGRPTRTRTARSTSRVPWSCSSPPSSRRNARTSA